MKLHYMEQLQHSLLPQKTLKQKNKKDKREVNMENVLIIERLTLGG